MYLSGKMSAHGTMGSWTDPAWWSHWAISRSSQFSTGITNALVCVILSVGSLAANRKEWPLYVVAAAVFIHCYLSRPLPYVRRELTVK